MTTRTLLIAVAAASVCALAGCLTATQALTPEQTAAYDIVSRLTFIDRTDLRTNETVTVPMRNYLASDDYARLSDPRGRALCKSAFEACRAAVAAPDGYRKGYLHGASQMAIAQVCFHYQLPGFETRPTLSALLGQLNELAERGRRCGMPPE